MDITLKKIAFMRKYLIKLVWLLFFALPVVLNSCKKDDEVKLDFDITVPDNWTEVIYANEGYIYSASRNAENTQDTILEALSVYKESLPNMTLNSYYNAVKPILFNSAAYNSLLYESDTTINMTDFKKMLSLETWGMVNRYQDTSYLDLLTTRYFFYEKNCGYNMVFVSLDSTFYRNQPIFNDIMSTFHYKY
jgi:hypothetical protein